MGTLPTPDRVVGRKPRKGRGLAEAASKPKGRAASDPKRGEVRIVVDGGLPRMPVLRTAVLGRASEMGLIGTEVQQVGARLSKRLVEQAKKQTGITSTTDLIEFALANVAVEDNFPQAFIDARGTLDPDLDIGF